MRLFPVRRLFGANRRGLVKGPAAVTGTKHLLDDGTFAEVTSTGVAASTAEALAGTDAAKFISPLTGNARALQGDMTRKISDCLYSDGATSNRRLEATPGTAGKVAGLPTTFWVKRFYVPTSNPSTTAYLSFVGGTSTPNASAALNPNAFHIYITTGGTLGIFQSGSTGSDSRSLTYLGFRAAYSGQWVQIVVSFPSGDSTTAPVITCNGVDITSSFTASTAGTPPNWMPTTLDCTKFLVGYNWPDGDVPEVEYGPGAWTAAEALAAAQTGLAPTWWRGFTGSAVPSYASDFSAGVNGWSVGGAGTVSADTANNELDITYGPLAGDRAHRYFTLSTTRTRLLVSFTVTNFSGSAGILKETTGGIPLSNAITADGNYSKEVTVSIASGGISFQPNIAGTTGSFSVSNLKIRMLGPVAKWEIQPVATCYDAGDNKIPLLLTSGITPVTNRRDWIIQAKTVTNGNEQLLGAAPFFDHTRHVIDDWVVNNKGSTTRTISLGQASAGTQFLNGGSAPVGRNVIALASKVPGANALWCNSNGTDELQHTVRGHIVD